MGQAVGGKLEKAFRAVEGEVDATRAPPFRFQYVDGVKLKMGNQALSPSSPKNKEFDWVWSCSGLVLSSRLRLCSGQGLCSVLELYIGFRICSGCGKCIGQSQVPILVLTKIFPGL